MPKSDSKTMLLAHKLERSEGAPQSARQVAQPLQHSRTSFQQKRSPTRNASGSKQLSSLMTKLKTSKSQGMMPGLDHIVSELVEKTELPDGEGRNAAWKSMKCALTPGDLRGVNEVVNPLISTVQEAQGMPTARIGSPRPSTPRAPENSYRTVAPTRVHKLGMPVIETSSNASTGEAMSSSRRSLATQSSSRTGTSTDTSLTRRRVSRTSSGRRRLLLDSSGHVIGQSSSSSKNDASARLSQLMRGSPASEEEGASSTTPSRRVRRVNSHKKEVLDRLERLSGATNSAVAEPVPLRRTKSRTMVGSKGSQTNLLNDSSHFVTGSRIRRFNSTSKIAL